MLTRSLCRASRRLGAETNGQGTFQCHVFQFPRLHDNQCICQQGGAGHEASTLCLAVAAALNRKHFPAQLVAAMRAAVHTVLQDLELSQPISAECAMGLLSDIHQGGRCSLTAMGPDSNLTAAVCSLSEDQPEMHNRLILHHDDSSAQARCLAMRCSPPLRSCMHAEFETAAGSGGWQGFLLPGDAEGAAPQVAAMLAEVRSVVAGPQFALAVKVGSLRLATTSVKAMADCCIRTACCVSSVKAC